MKTNKNGTQRCENIGELQAQIGMPAFKELMAQDRAEYGWQDAHKVSVFSANKSKQLAVFVMGKGKSTRYASARLVGSEILWSMVSPDEVMALR